uniref:TROVE domain-containing protein n=1 Tax=Romanomermis culicivorax TaxID=13658 RepID=A0A915HRD2_ROMCU
MFMRPGLDQTSEWAKLEPFGDTIQATHQSVKSREDEVLNSAGGFVFSVSDIMQLRRFLILGTSGGTYYATERQLTLQNADNILNMLEKGRGLEILKEVEMIDSANRAPSMNPIIYCLAVVARNGDAESKAEVYRLLPKICRIPTHLFKFIAYAEKATNGKSTGWVRRHRKAVGDWYIHKNLMNLVMAITKYQKRDGWSHRDVLRLAHPCVSRSRAMKRHIDGRFKSLDESKMSSAEVQAIVKEVDSYHDDVFLYCAKGFGALLERRAEFTEYIIKNLEDNTSALDISCDNGKEQKTTDETKLAKKKYKLMKKSKRFTENAPNYLKFLQSVEDLKSCKDENEAVALIKRFSLVREHVPTRLLSSVVVWRCLLENMPMTAMIRNLGKMTAVGLLKEEDNVESDIVCKKLNDVDALKAARIHPFAILLALSVYRQKSGEKGNRNLPLIAKLFDYCVIRKLTWEPNKSVLAALDSAFYASFVNVRPTNKRFLLAIDVSGSMSANINNTCLSCREAVGALSMVTLRTEPVCEMVAFQDDLQELSFEKTDTLEMIDKKMSDLPFGGTDCSLPMLWAARKKKQFDCIIVYTDSETYFGNIKPAEAMRLYRKMSGVKGMDPDRQPYFGYADPDSCSSRQIRIRDLRDAKLIVVGMTATNFTIADPSDPNMMDVVGFDAAAPELIRNFVASGFEIDDGNEKSGNKEWDAALGDD